MHPVRPPNEALLPSHRQNIWHTPYCTRTATTQSDVKIKWSNYAALLPGRDGGIPPDPGRVAPLPGRVSPLIGRAAAPPLGPALPLPIVGGREPT